MIQRFVKPDSNFIYVTFSGDVNDAQVIEHLHAMPTVLAGLTEVQELCDCRDTFVNALTVQGCVQAAQNPRMLETLRSGRLAFLVSNDLLYGMARAYQMFAEESGREIGIFYDIEEALAFLDTAESKEELLAFIKNAG